MCSRLNQISDWAVLAAATGYTVNKLAKACKVSPRQLERFFFEATGKTPHLWLTELRQTQALSLMRDGLSVKEAAARLGYKQAGHFSREFKRFHGAIPTIVRQAVPEKSHLDMRCRV